MAKVGRHFELFHPLLVQFTFPFPPLFLCLLFAASAMIRQPFPTKNDLKQPQKCDPKVFLLRAAQRMRYPGNGLTLVCTACRKAIQE